MGSALTRRAATGVLAAAAVAGPAMAQARPRVKFVTSMGEFTVELYPDAAPKTVANFLQYVKDGHYNGTIFHRVIPGFMVQGGGFDTGYKQKPTRASVPHEGKEAMAKGLKNTVGTLAMARTSDPQSASSQFFINVTDNAFLDPGNREPWGYTVFGKVVSGMDVVEKIRTVPTGPGGPFPGDVPRTQVVVTSATAL
jgi:peptidyl-prolyl cis-trans isomerase A (cyclophilin A)